MPYPQNPILIIKAPIFGSIVAPFWGWPFRTLLLYLVKPIKGYNGDFRFFEGFKLLGFQGFKGLGVQGLRVLGFGIWGFGFRVKGSWDSGPGIRVLHSASRQNPKTPMPQTPAPSPVMRTSPVSNPTKPHKTLQNTD